MADETTTPTPDETPAPEVPASDVEAQAEPQIDPADLTELLTSGLADLLEMAEPAREFEGEKGRYKLTTLGAWTVRQNLVAREIYKRVIKKLKESRAADGPTEGRVNFMALLDALLDDEALWCDLFSILYIPDDAARWSAERAREYREDMLEMTNQQAVGALAFFITSSVSSIPRDILAFFRGMPMVAAVMSALDEHKQRHAAKSAGAIASST